jgi:hypothetical protein
MLWAYFTMATLFLLPFGGIMRGIFFNLFLWELYRSPNGKTHKKCGALLPVWAFPTPPTRQVFKCQTCSWQASINSSVTV